jgi:acyl-CoA synthetase (AMP-forming)/AMP-acid ligase II
MVASAARIERFGEHMIFTSPLPDPIVPNETFTTYVLGPAADVPDRAALIDAPSGRTLTYAQLAAGVRAAAAGLARRGLRKGDVVAIDSPNLPEYAVAFHGIASAGGIVTTLSPLFTADEVARQLTDSRARFLITVPQLIDKAKAAAAGSAIEEIFVFGEAPGATPFAELLDFDAQPPDVDIDPANDIVVMPYSSGTTGMPKGVMLTHRNLVANIAQLIQAQPYPDAVAIGVLPFFHIYGMVVVMSSMLRERATIVTMPRFEMVPFLDALQKYRVNCANLVPPIILALARHPAVDSYDLSSLAWITSGAAPLAATLIKACAERIGCEVRQGYGLTETSPVTHIVPPLPAAQHPGSVGPPIPGTEMMIVDIVTGEPLGPRQDGEVWVRGPQVMKGYFNNPRATADMITSDGWLRTGDIGHANDDGYLFIVDRAKELIKYKGFQVAPAELEAILLKHPAVADAAVIGVHDEEAGEVPKAFIVRAHDVDASDIMDFLARSVAPYKKLRYIEFRDSIPRSPSGKILRRVLIAEERARAS